ncbi:MAG: glycosyltransferase [Deltaproteobacteria bacterium]|nr:glycosyltransferase [Deltaproteobacteria bacterium]
MQANAGHGDTTVEVVAAGHADTRTQEGTCLIERVQSHTLFAGEGAPEVWERARSLQRLGLAVEAARFTMALAQRVRTRAERWDRIHSHWLVPSTLAVTLANTGKPHVAFVHSGDVAALEALPGGARLARWIVCQVQGVVCVSDDLALRLERLVGKPWPTQVGRHVQAMPVDPAAFAPRLTPPSKRSGILGVGRLVPIKGFHTLVLALGGLPVRRRPALTLLGEGPERARLARLACELGVSLHLRGAVHATQVAGEMARAAACVVPSRRLPSGRTEGYPLVVAEALGLGTPVIATAVGGLAGLGSHPLVTLVPQGDVGGLRSALSRLPPA